MVIERWSTWTLGATGAVAGGLRRATSSPDDLLVAAHRCSCAAGRRNFAPGRRSVSLESRCGVADSGFWA